MNKIKISIIDNFVNWMADSIGREYFSLGEKLKYTFDIGNSSKFISLEFLYNSFLEYCDEKHYKIEENKRYGRDDFIEMHKTFITMPIFEMLLDGEGLQQIEIKGRKFSEEAVQRIKENYFLDK